MFSDRVSVHFTGRPSSNAAFAAIRCSGYNPFFAPKPPPTAGLKPRSNAGSSPRFIAISSRTPCGPCVAAWNVRPPAGSPGTTTMPFGSIGTGATRWFTIRWRTTTSASSSTPSIGPVPIAFATFEPCPSWTSVAVSVTAAAGSTTAGRSS